jgi:3'(2'), 5'-bisphosphate nucleotidase
VTQPSSSHDPFTAEQLRALARALIPVAREAGDIEVKYYRQWVAAENKADGSPVSDADRNAEKLIRKYLAQLAPGIPVVGEEGVSTGDIPDISGGVYFLVDPLDGTKEFINHTGDFTVNIALMVDHKPVMGVIYAPLSDALYVAGGGEAFSVIAGGPETKLAVRALPAAGLAVLEGKRPGDAEKTAALLKGRAVEKTLDRSSSLKFCAIAAGEADIYPRLGGTCEWDTAAGEAILRAAGGKISTLDGEPLSYGKAKDKFRNPDFIATGAEEAWPLKKKKIVLASTSPVKIEAVRQAFGAATEIIAVKVPSGVSDQPMNEETLTGAFNRLARAQEQVPDADLYVAIENGIFEEKGRYIDRPAIAMATRDGAPQVTLGEGVEFPDAAVNEARRRGFATCTPGQVMQEQGIVKDHTDPHKDLTGKSRAEYLKETVKKAAATLNPKVL